MESSFIVGVKVAHIYTGWERTITGRIVGKVRKDGKFFLAWPNGELETRTMWTPDRHNPTRAHPAGKTHSKYRYAVEIWTEEHDKEIEQQKLVRQRQNKLEKVQAWVKDLRANSEEDGPIIDGLFQLIPLDKTSMEG